jgi:hypothetical protein
VDNEYDAYLCGSFTAPSVVVNGQIIICSSHQWFVGNTTMAGPAASLYVNDYYDDYYDEFQALQTNLTVTGNLYSSYLYLDGSVTIDGVGADFSTGGGSIDITQNVNATNSGVFLIDQYSNVEVHGSVNTSAAGHFDMIGESPILRVRGDINLNGATSTWSDGQLILHGSLHALAPNQITALAAHVLAIYPNDAASGSTIATMGSSLGSLDLQNALDEVRLDGNVDLLGDLDVGESSLLIKSFTTTTRTLTVHGSARIDGSIFQNVALDIADAASSQVGDLHFTLFNTDAPQLTMRGDNATVHVVNPTFDGIRSGAVFISAIGSAFGVDVWSIDPYPGASRFIGAVTWGPPPGL